MMGGSGGARSCRWTSTFGAASHPAPIQLAARNVAHIECFCAGVPRFIRPELCSFPLLAGRELRLSDLRYTRTLCSMRRIVRSGILVMAWVALATPTLADVVGPPPTNCIPGTIGEASHAGPYCQIETCEDDGGCAAGLECHAQGFCIEDIRGASFGGPFTVPHAVALCSPDEPCARGECRPFSICPNVGAAEGSPTGTAGSTSGGGASSSPGLVPVSGGSTGCSCRTARRDGASQGVWLALVAFGVALRRRVNGAA
jgi:MYXO-CTERM domain-containing protein